jgi:hypothetical protein
MFRNYLFSVGQRLAAPWRVLVVYGSAILCGLVVLHTVAALGHSYLPQVAIAGPVLDTLKRYPVLWNVLAVFTVILELSICVAVHELGHAFGAKLAGWRVYVISIGPLSYFPRERRFASARGYRVTGDVGGWVLAAALDGGTTRGNLLFTLGGPVANLVLAAGGFVTVTVYLLTLRYPLALWKPYIFFAWDLWLLLLPFWLLVLIGVSTCSFIIGIANLVPMWGKGWRSDGAKALTLLREGPKIPPNWHLVLLYMLARVAVRPAYWGARLIRKVEDYEGTPQENVLRDRLLSRHYFAIGDVGRARVAAERIMKSSVTKSVDEPIAYAFLLAIVDGNAAEAKRILDEVPENVRSSFEYCRAQAIVCYLLGDFNGALKAVRMIRRGDRDDRALFRAIRRRRPLPKIVPRVAPA